MSMLKRVIADENLKSCDHKAPFSCRQKPSNPQHLKPVFVWIPVIFISSRKTIGITICKASSRTTHPSGDSCVWGGVDKRVSKTLVCLLWTGTSSSSSSVVKTYSSVLHEFKAGAEVCQADVTLLIQQNVVRLDVPEGGAGEETKSQKTLQASVIYQTVFWTNLNA